MLARIKLNSIESKISKALMNNQISHEDFMISHEDFMTITDEEIHYKKLKEGISMMKSQEDKKQILINLSKIKTMLSCCLKCKKILRTLV